MSGKRRRIVRCRKELRSAVMNTAAAIARFVLGLVFVVFGLRAPVGSVEQP